MNGHHGFKLEDVEVEDEFFTHERIQEWKRFLSEICKNVCEELFELLDVTSGISYFVNKALIDETVYDAIIGMKKIINSTPNPIVKPNVFKITAYLTYWFLRHKPISVLYNLSCKQADGSETFVEFDSLVKPKVDGVNKDYLVWQLNHINEIIAVAFCTSFIFDFDKPICDEKRCSYIIKRSAKNKNECSFSFDSFAEQKEFMFDKMTYYFSYRAIAPKVIEHFLEAYAFHPAWELTGAHWNTNG